jgi:transcriptional regulator with XRE-family HTH domain
MVGTKNTAGNATLSRHGREAITLLGQLIKGNRIKRKLGVEELATRVGISRDMLYRIERGDPRCNIGAVFEAATIVGVPLFEEEPGRLSSRIREQSEFLKLLPKAVRKSDAIVNDDF